MVTVEILRRATAHAGIKAVLNRLAKDALINRQIDLTTDTGNVPGQPNLLRLNFLPENRQNVHVNTNPASHEQFDFGSHDQPDPVSRERFQHDADRPLEDPEPAVAGPDAIDVCGAAQYRTATSKLTIIGTQPSG